MKSLIFSTGNAMKFGMARDTCRKYAIEVIQRTLDIDEIQSENADKIARDKASKAFAILKRPVLVSDDSWAIPALNGWPGAYMSSMNKWLDVDDFLRLCEPLKDRSIILTQLLVYKDDKSEKVFRHNLTGKLLKEARGDSIHPNHQITVMDGDNGLTIAELTQQQADQSSRRGADIYHEFAKWYSMQK